jgi:hypothetical protein
VEKVGMKRAPSRNELERAPETEAWKIIFSAFAVSGSLVIGWTLFVLLTDPAPHPARLVDAPSEMGAHPKLTPPAKP